MFNRYTISILSFFLFHFVLPAQNIDDIKKQIKQSIERQKVSLIKTSDAIWEFAETSLLEFESSKTLMDYAHQE
jgi:hypothetical protein